MTKILTLKRHMSSLNPETTDHQPATITITLKRASCEWKTHKIFQ